MNNKSMSLQAKRLQDIPGKDVGLSVLGDAPFVAETPPHLLDDDTTPVSRFFLRNNGLWPDEADDREGWTFAVDGEVRQALTLSLRDLKERFEPVTLRMVIECGGNGRSFYHPPTPGNPWTHGGVGCAEWTGVRLRDVLEQVGLKVSALFTGHYGSDPNKNGVMSPPPMSRGVPIAKALDDHTLIAFAMNGEPLPYPHGGPLRLVVPGWPGSLSTKWLKRIWIRDREHDEPGMTGQSYRLPAQPVPPGSSGEGVEFRVIESMPVRAIITSPANGALVPKGTAGLHVRGAAWAGDHEVARVEVSADDGVSWMDAAMEPPRNRYDWVRWTAEIPLRSGAQTLSVRATDSRGNVQPPQPENWNPQGYACNVIHRVSVTVE
jgi:DMSO/TMAO reductase YedYZ molybdopterin-dependent catalytic subunit